ncbi:MAG: hypothetical protein K1W17_08695 [Oscillospiraceae bacterium]
MCSDIITVMYREYLNSEFEGIQALKEEDLRFVYENLEEFEKKYNISLSEHNDIENNIILEATNVSECKGFTNGFKLAVRLIFEAYGIVKQ